MASANEHSARRNVAGGCGTICAVLALLAWALLIVVGLVLSKEYAADHREFADLNSLEKLIHAIKTIFAGGIFGVIGLAVGGVCSFLAILLSGIGLAFEPKKLAITGIVFGVLSILAGITFLLLLVLTVSRMNAATRSTPRLDPTWSLAEIPAPERAKHTGTILNSSREPSLVSPRKCKFPNPVRVC